MLVQQHAAGLPATHPCAEKDKNQHNTGIAGRGRERQPTTMGVGGAMSETWVPPWEGGGPGMG